MNLDHFPARGAGRTVPNTSATRFRPAAPRAGRGGVEGGHGRRAGRRPRPVTSIPTPSLAVRARPARPARPPNLVWRAGGGRGQIQLLIACANQRPRPAPTRGSYHSAELSHRRSAVIAVMGPQQRHIGPAPPRWAAANGARIFARKQHSALGRRPRPA